MLQGFLQGIRELTFPDNCFLCRQYLNSHHQKQLCNSCLSKIQLNTPPFCLKCSRHLTLFNHQGLCPTCVKTNYSFDEVWAACIYQDPLPDLIHAFKYHGKTSLKNLFNQIILNHLKTYQISLEQFDMIIPIPLHPTRYRERGFNQAELLSQVLTQHFNIRFETKTLHRSKFTASQTTYEAKQRWTNVDGAFRIDSSLNIADKSILLVDDLLTTGATADSASFALKNAGAAYVGILTLAITP